MPDYRFPLLSKLRLPLRISERRLLLTLGDALAVNAAVLLALRIWAWVGEITFTWNFIIGQIQWFIALTVLWFILAQANDFYNLRLTANLRLAFLRLLQITLLSWIVYLAIYFVSPRTSLPRLFILYYGAASLIFISLWRASRPFLVGWTGWRRSILVVGTGHAAETIIRALRDNMASDYTIAGCAGSPTEDAHVAGTPILGSSRDLPALARKFGAEEIVVALDVHIDKETFHALMDCYELGLPLIPMPLLYEQVTRRVPVEHIGDEWSLVLPIEPRSAFNPYPLLKRLIDLGLGFTGLVAFAALLPFLAAIIYLDSPGPIFYRQMRVGKAGIPYWIIKLRSMVPDAEKESGPMWATPHDDRVTRVGRWLRKTRLDELPQLINVLRGEMSFIGPRPERPDFVAELQKQIPFYRARHTVVPGLTGWAQVEFRYGSSVADTLTKLQYDLYYIRHQSLALDGLIFLKTVGTLLKMKGT